MNALFNLFSAFGLSSAAGLNAYIPLLAVGLLSRYTGLVQLQAPYEVLASPIVLGVLGVLAVIDFVADKVPVVDHITHAFGVIVHPIAGAILFASQSGAINTIHPAIALFAGIAVAGGLHASRTALRPVATATTGGIANPVLSLLEDITSVLLSFLAIFVPILAFALFVILLWAAFRGWRRVKGSFGS